jgi:prepilin-type N-terminal cleavage/methylation domain-containing protein
VEGRHGFTLIEVVLVMAIIAITLGLAGPRIGAGLGTLELRQSEQMVKTCVRYAQIRARRADRDCYLVLDNTHSSIAVLDPDMKLLRQQNLPTSVSFVLPESRKSVAIDVPASGIIHANSVRLRGRAGELEVLLR